MRFGVVIFPGSNCDYDSFYVLNNVIGVKTDFIWHKEKNLSDYDLIVLPGGFSYGDYLRSGAIARFSPVMKEVKNFAEKGGLVLGICNGFQVLLESGMLPGAMLRNKNLNFICKYINIKVENNKTPWTTAYKKGEVLKIPIAHADGNYYASDKVMEELKKDDRIVFRYSNETGDTSDEYNPNGSRFNIAGIINKKGNVLGMMPHPERASEKLLGSEDGKKLFISVVNYLKDK